MHIVYAAQDELLALNPNTGSLTWQFPYPKTGLTNSVTPIALDNGKLLVAGQGFEGTCLLNVEPNNDSSYRVEKVWHTSKQQPFYCNWAQLQTKPNLVVGFASKTLFTLDWQSGTIQSQLRSWTDSNVVAAPDGAIAVRGDGFVGTLNFSGDRPVQVAGYGKIRDRIWCAPTIADGSLFVRGRTALHCVPLSQLQNSEPMRSGTAITSMDAMYGAQNEVIEELIGKAKNSAKSFTWEDYAEKASDDSVPFSEGAYSQIVKSLASSQRDELGLRVATDWVNRQPLSILAFQSKVMFLRSLGRETDATEEETKRLVEVEFLVTTASNLSPETNLILVGSASSLGDWANPGLKLHRESDNAWRAKASVPRGDLQFKVANGNVKKMETRADGRKISNRRFRIQSSCEILVNVEAFQETNGQ
jgi:hypothetical protein